jgi:colanic acid/amylovoran biosynthesis glycosyltransferase
LCGVDLILILFTTSYPYDFASEQTFLQREIPYLEEKFDKVLLVPRICRGNKLDVPHGVEVDKNFADYIKKNSNIFRFVINVMNSKTVCQELSSQPSLLFFPAKLLRLILFSGRVQITKNWLMDWLAARHFEDKNIILYSYWFDDITMGLGLIRQTDPNIKLVSRAHGYDIYEELYFPYYWPLRKQALASLDKLFPASYNGRDYFRNRYPEFYELFETVHLGVKDPGFITKPSVDNVLRIVSCAYLDPVKRISLLIESIACAARMRPELNFEWCHFGEGKTRRKLIKMVKNTFPNNAVGELPGYVPNQDVLRHYKKNPVDVFVNLSTTEGGAPVSIMEAISCGVPVIATNVGGNPEIVSKRNGLLLPPNPTPKEVAQALLQICDDRKMSYKMREESRRVWQESYNADVNFQDFAEKIKHVCRN